MPIKLDPKYQCGICDEIHDDALKCCGFNDDTPPMPTAAELEAAGQQRLF